MRGITPALSGPAVQTMAILPGELVTGVSGGVSPIIATFLPLQAGNTVGHAGMAAEPLPGAYPGPPALCASMHHAVRPTVPPTMQAFVQAGVCPPT